MNVATASLSERFWAKVRQTDGCWEWTGAMSVDGYGRIMLNRKSINAHRIAYHLMVGPIPAGLTIDHLCRNRACVNPAHLEAVTRGENVLRGESASARHARKTHCKHGHPFDDVNTIHRFADGRPGRELPGMSETPQRGTPAARSRITQQPPHMRLERGTAAEKGTVAHP